MEKIIKNKNFNLWNFQRKIQKQRKFIKEIERKIFNDLAITKELLNW